MQLGYTIPLQKHLGIRSVPCGAPCDQRFCWELHVLRPNGRPSLFAVHASSRYAFLLYDPPEAFWQELPHRFHLELRCVLGAEGFDNGVVERYLSMAGEMEVTKTHGRRPVAFLNRGVDDLYALPVGMDPDLLEQQLVRLLLNDRPCRAAGHGERGTARDFLHREVEDLSASGFWSPAPFDTQNP